jgi:glutathione S-transferase
MTGHRLLVHAAFLYLLPVLVAVYGVSVPGAVALVLLALLWRWGISLSAFMAPAQVPELELETITASHFVEKVRWSMDRLGLDYTEKQVGGTLGAFFLGRTVPQLKIRTGAVRSVIGNSPEILRYLWGAYACPLGERADFLQATEERLALEKQLDRYGVDLQVWVYYHCLPHRAVTLRAWGVDNPQIPAWQREALKFLYPVLQALIRKAFRITDSHFVRAVSNIESRLAEVEARLADGRRYLLGGEESDYVDITFAAFSGLWLQPREYGGGVAESVRIEREAAPRAMREHIEGWIAAYPRATEFVERMYREERRPIQGQAL